MGWYMWTMPTVNWSFYYYLLYFLLVYMNLSRLHLWSHWVVQWWMPFICYSYYFWFNIFFFYILFLLSRSIQFWSPLGFVFERAYVILIMLIISGLNATLLAFWRRPLMTKHISWNLVLASRVFRNWNFWQFVISVHAHVYFNTVSASLSIK